MSDVKVSVVAIDSAMDCFEKISEAANNYQKVVQYDISQLRSSIAYKVQNIRARIASLYDHLSYLDDEDDTERDRIMSEIQDLEYKLSQLEALNSRTRRMEAQYLRESKAMTNAVSTDVSGGLRVMAAYLREISSINGADGSGTVGSVSNIFTGESNYSVVVIDSAQYPESAEHIRAAVKAGQPAMLTLNRSGADANRRQSLVGVPRSPIYDRDEYPPAAFAEGGTGAHVAYISPADNQGSGASFRWQLNGIPDGTRVRFRVI